MSSFVNQYYGLISPILNEIQGYRRNMGNARRKINLIIVSHMMVCPSKVGGGFPLKDRFADKYLSEFRRSDAQDISSAPDRHDL